MRGKARKRNGPMRGRSRTLPRRARSAKVFVLGIRTRRILADRACDIHGKSRAQVLESGGRVAKGITSEARNLDGTDDSGRKTRTALAVIQSGMRGTQAKYWESLKPRMPWLAPPSIPVRER